MDRRLLIYILAGGLPVAPCFANNGLNLIGHGTESVAMGGTDVAIARDTFALNINPAGLAQIDATRIDANAILVRTNRVYHRDSYGNDIQNDNDPIIGGTFGYAQRIEGMPLTIGVGAFAQGGTGVEFNDLTTAFSTTDSLKSILRLARLNIGAAYEVDSKWSLGGALVLSYADNEVELFPDTSYFSGNLATSFFGYRITGMKATGFGAILGVQYKPSETVTLGAAYTTATKLVFDGGQYISNQSSIGGGTVTYQDVQAEGINLPQQLGLGIAMQASPAWLLSLEIDWLDWSSAIDTSTLSISNPDSATPVTSRTVNTEQNWNDQIVYSIGVAYQYSEALLIRGGYNYGKQPVPAEHLTPLLSPIAEEHIGAGISFKLNTEWRLDFTYLLEKRNSVTYTNPSIPFGTNTVIDGRVDLYYFGLIRIW